MNKICTTIEQSKKLIELGIDRKTSDMYYWCGEDLRIGGYKAQDEDYDISAWSLTALLDILPHGKALIHDKENRGYKCICNNMDTYFHDNPVDACYEMILKLNELKML